jgi:protein tyrosine phosphatase (PTP) superfamily phosphohydrolase (DUF442 family)
MAKLALTRRNLLKQTSIGVATMGVLSGMAANLPALTTAITNPDVTEAEQALPTLDGPLVAHIRDVTTGEISLLFGHQEVIYKDLDLVTRLLRAAH